MEQSDQYSSSGGRQPPRKELQGPRPTPLKVRKAPHKIKKPPVAPLPPATHHQPPPSQAQSQPPPRPPVIIYAVSPKIIHTNPSDFMTLVQRLTGPDTTISTGAIASPAARHINSGLVDTTGFEYLSGTRDGGGFTHSSILSPEPAGLTRPVPHTFFTDPISPLISLYHQHQHDHLKAIQQIQNGGGDINTNVSFPIPSPSPAAFLSPNPMLSPASIDFLTRLLDQ